MPKPEKNAMALVDACRTPIRRKIMILAEEANAQQLRVTAKSLSEMLDIPLSTASYHAKELVKAGALKTQGGIQKRGAWQRFLVPTEAFQASMTDTVALDQIAETLDDDLSTPPYEETVHEIKRLLRATGRPVEA